MQQFKITWFVLLIVFTSCKGKEVSILETRTTEGKSDKSFIEGCIKSSSTPGDTLLYYKFDLSSDRAVFKESIGLDLGIMYSRNIEGKKCTINLGFESVPKSSRFDTLQIIDYGNRKTFTNFNDRDLNKRTEVAIGYLIDEYMAPNVSQTFANEKRMKKFLSLFESEISKALKNTDRFDYSCTSHLDGYFQDINLIATIK